MLRPNPQDGFSAIDAAEYAAWEDSVLDAHEAAGGDFPHHDDDEDHDEDTGHSDHWENDGQPDEAQEWTDFNGGFEC